MFLELFWLLVLGSVFIILGLQVSRKQKISWIHDYHYKNVKPEDMQKYTKQMGIGLIIIGLFTFITGIINYLLHTEIGWIIYVIGFILGFIVMNKAQKIYNGGWFN